MVSHLIDYLVAVRLVAFEEVADSGVLGSHFRCDTPDADLRIIQNICTYLAISGQYNLILLSQVQPLVLQKEVARQLPWIGQPGLPWFLLLVDLLLQVVDQILIGDNDISHSNDRNQNLKKVRN